MGLYEPVLAYNYSRDCIGLQGLYRLAGIV